MSTVGKAKIVSGQVIAPWLTLAGRVLKSLSLYEAAIKADPIYLCAVAGLRGDDDPSRLVIAQLHIAAMLPPEPDEKGAHDIKSMMAMSDEQILQDVFFAIVLDGKRDRFFIEVGVGTGRAISSAYVLETHTSWKGILVEPNCSLLASIAACRTTHLKPRAVSSASGQILTFQEYADANEYSRVASACGHLIPASEIKEYTVETTALNDVLKAVSPPREPKFLSIDIEGGKLWVLIGLDFIYQSFKALTIEHNHVVQMIDGFDSALNPHRHVRLLPDISNFDARYVHDSVKPQGYNISTWH
jgi:FkbM family methyltransferase